MNPPNPSLILAIETSCDETSAAVIKDGSQILSNIVASQEKIHAKYGGVFPEVASRKHIEVIHPVVSEALNEANTAIQEIDYVAVTEGPGLVGSLLVGVNVAKGLAIAADKPLIGVNHIEGHIYAQWLATDPAEIEFPLLVLVVSGGHTELYLMHDHCRYEHLGGTMDDAAGEAFDKVGRLLDLPYPGGPAIDRISKEGDQEAFHFPRAVMDDGYEFSFSGLKTAVLRETQRFNKQKEESEVPTADLAASFQAAVVDALVTKTKKAAEAYQVKAVHLTGGVSANSLLRSEMERRLAPLAVRFPPLSLCTDNAAMIGAAAYQQIRLGAESDLALDVFPNLPI